VLGARPAGAGASWRDGGRARRVVRAAAVLEAAGFDRAAVAAALGPLLGAAVPA
jgi:hypothetical protein